MPLTGLDISKYFDQKIAQSYTGYVDSIKKNRIFKEALIAVCEKKYLNDNTTKIKDEVSFLTKTNVIFNLNNNELYTAALQIVDVTTVALNVLRVTTRLPHNLINGDTVKISGVLANTFLPDGSYSVILNTDFTFQIAVLSSSGTYTANTGTVTTINTSPVVIVSVGIATITVASLVATVTTGSVHGLLDGDVVSISGVVASTFLPAGTYTVDVIEPSIFKITLASSSGVYTPGTGTVLASKTNTVTNQKMVADYWHILTTKALYSDIEYNVSISSITGNSVSPIVVTMSSFNSYRSYEQITISGVLGNTAANGTFYIKKLSNFKFALYSDIYLQSPVAGNGAYTNVLVLPQISRPQYNYCVPYESNVKIGRLNIPTTFSPAYEIADNLIKIYPLTLPCTQITMDYVQVPPVIIDVTNTTTDLTLYYPEKLLYLIIDQASVIFAQESSDVELFKEGQSNIAQHQ